MQLQVGRQCPSLVRKALFCNQLQAYSQGRSNRKVHTNMRYLQESYAKEEKKSLDCTAQRHRPFFLRARPYRTTKALPCTKRPPQAFAGIPCLANRTAKRQLSGHRWPQEQGPRRIIVTIPSSQPLLMHQAHIRDYTALEVFWKLRSSKRERSQMT